MFGLDDTVLSEVDLKRSLSELQIARCRLCRKFMFFSAFPMIELKQKKKKKLKLKHPEFCVEF